MHKENESRVNPSGPFRHSASSEASSQPCPGERGGAWLRSDLLRAGGKWSVFRLRTRAGHVTGAMAGPAEPCHPWVCPPPVLSVEPWGVLAQELKEAVLRSKPRLSEGGS